MNCVEPGGDPFVYGDEETEEEKFQDQVVKVYRLMPDGSPGELIRTMPAFPGQEESKVLRLLRLEGKGDESVAPRPEKYPDADWKAIFTRMKEIIEEQAITTSQAANSVIIEMKLPMSQSTIYKHYCEFEREERRKQQQAPNPDQGTNATSEPGQGSTGPANAIISEESKTDPAEEQAFNQAFDEQLAKQDESKDTQVGDLPRSAYRPEDNDFVEEENPPEFSNSFRMIETPADGFPCGGRMAKLNTYLDAVKISMINMISDSNECKGLTCDERLELIQRVFNFRVPA